MKDRDPVDERATLERRRAAALGVAPAARIATGAEAELWLARVGCALRYQATAGLPLASVRSASGPLTSRAALERSIHLTNHLLQTRAAVEVMVVAGRPVLVDRALVPALYVLVRRGRAPRDRDGLGLHARAAADLIEARGHVSAGDVRTHLGLPAAVRADPGYEALLELQRQMLVDRGPFRMPATGIPYLSREGYPYHFFHVAHDDLVRPASRLTHAAAADQWLGAYLASAIFASTRRLSQLFKLFLTPAEIEAALGRLDAAGRVRWGRAGRDRVVVLHAGGA